MRDSISQDDTESLIHGYTHSMPEDSATERCDDSDRENLQKIRDVITRFFQTFAP